MAYAVSTTAITAAERTAFTADKSFFLAKNALEYRLQNPQWRVAGSWASGTDVTATGYPGANGADGLIDLPTKPNVQGPTVDTYYLLFDLDSAPSGITNAIDTILIIGHNFQNLAGVISVTVQIADDSTFATNLIAIATFTPTTIARLVSLSLSSFTRYTNVRYLRVKVSTTTTFASVPWIGEVIAGQRRQLGRRPNRPWDPYAMAGEQTRFRSKSGGSVKYVRNKGGALLHPSWEPEIGVEVTTGLNDYATLKSVFSDCARGTKNILFVDKPTTEPSYAYWMEMDTPAQTLPEEEVSRAATSMTLIEQSPFVHEELAA